MSSTAICTIRSLRLFRQGQFTTVYIAGANTTTVVNPGTQHLAHGTYVFSPTMLLNVGYSFSNGNIVSTPSGFLSSAQSPDVKPTLVYPNTVGLIPNLSIAGMTALSGSVAYTDHGTNHQFYGDLTKIVHNHTFIFGFSYNHYQKLENNTTGTQGGFTFASDSGFSNVPTNNNGGANEAQGFANFLTGNANGGFSQLSRDPVTDQKFSLYEGFAQDNFKVNPRLTLNLGVRYGYYGQPWDANWTDEQLRSCQVYRIGGADHRQQRPDLRYRAHAARRAATLASPRRPTHRRTSWASTISTASSTTARRRPTTTRLRRGGTKWAKRRRLTLRRVSALLTMCSATERPRCAAATVGRMTTPR